jgi:hypothetical protein
MVTIKLVLVNPCVNARAEVTLLRAAFGRKVAGLMLLSTAWGAACGRYCQIVTSEHEENNKHTCVPRVECQ